MMPVVTKTFSVCTSGNSDVVDVTADVARAVASSKINAGIAVVFVAGSTAAISTIEFEPGLKKDVPRALDKIAPYDADYEHHKRWGCDNGAAHVRSTVVGTSFTVPFSDKKLILGTWQQICLLDFDTRAREREVVVQVLGSQK
ncbi:MAG: secondary thiamine-phosphate synthase enzyme YjbQ [archaeon]